MPRRLHWSDEDFGSPARLRDLLGRERAKDTTLDYGEPELDPIAAYAERRGLEPSHAGQRDRGAPGPRTARAGA